MKIFSLSNTLSLLGLENTEFYKNQKALLNGKRLRTVLRTLTTVGLSLGGKSLNSDEKIVALNSTSVLELLSSFKEDYSQRWFKMGDTIFRLEDKPMDPAERPNDNNKIILFFHTLSSEGIAQGRFELRYSSSGRILNFEHTVAVSNDYFGLSYPFNCWRNADPIYGEYSLANDTSRYPIRDYFKTVWAATEGSFPLDSNHVYGVMREWGSSASNGFFSFFDSLYSDIEAKSLLPQEWQVYEHIRGSYDDPSSHPFVDQNGRTQVPTSLNRRLQRQREFFKEWLATQVQQPVQQTAIPDLSHPTP